MSAAATSLPSWRLALGELPRVEILLDLLADLLADRRVGDHLGLDRLFDRGSRRASDALAQLRPLNRTRLARLAGLARRAARNSSISSAALARIGCSGRRRPPAGWFFCCIFVNSLPIPARMRNAATTISLISSGSMAASRGTMCVHPVLLVFRPVAVMPALAIDERMSVSAWMLRSL